ncbi:MAG: DUF86 domain-containing protein [Alphaproteobacteria bacterium]|nr:DUF86 domain-containing protein [Alphaproteobacteria bacterium]
MPRGDGGRVEDILLAIAAIRDARPDVPWRAISGMRDRVVHDYFRTNTRRIWDVVTDDLDPLENALRKGRPTP